MRVYVYAFDPYDLKGLTRDEAVRRVEAAGSTTHLSPDRTRIEFKLFAHFFAAYVEVIEVDVMGDA